MTVAFSLNPGFPLLLGAMLALVAPQSARSAIGALSTFAGLLLLFVQDFGQSAALSQLGLALVPMRMDALSQTFGLAFLLLSALLALHGADGRSKTEEAALLAQAGGAVAALFAGDLVSFIAAAEVAAFAGAALLLTRTEAAAQRAGLAMLGWQALGAVALLAGAAGVIAAGDAPIMAHTSLASPAGALLAIGLWVKAAGPGAHFWLKNAVPRPSAAGALALLAFTPILSIYAGIRLFDGATVLVTFGAASCVLAAFYGLREREPMAGAAHAMMGQLGLAWIAIGLKSSSASAAHIFCVLPAMTVLVFALGEARDRLDPDEPSAPERRLWRALPFSAAAAGVAGASLAGAPMLVGAIGLSLLFEAARPFGATPLIALCGAVGIAAAHGAILLPWGAFSARRSVRTLPGALSAAQYAMVAALALLVAFGLQPDWLRGFLPTHSGAPVHPRLALALLGQSLCVAAVVVAAAMIVGRLRAPQRAIALDVAVGAAFAEGAAMLGRNVIRAHERWRRAEAALATRIADYAARALSRLDRPSGPLRREAFWLLAAVAAFMAATVVSL